MTDRQHDRTPQEGDVFEMTQRYKVIGIEKGRWGGYDVLTMKMVDGKPKGMVERWMNGLHDREGTEIDFIDE